MIFQQEAGEAIFVVMEAEGPVADLFISYGRAGDGTKGLSAGGTGAVARPYLDVIGEVRKSIDGLVHLVCALVLGAFHTGGLFEEVGASDIAYENEVTGEEHNRFGACWRVGQ